MNLGAYAQVLEQAEADAVKYKSARVVVYRPDSDEFRHFYLHVHTMNENPGFQELIVASVDHEGIITESRWVKQQMGVVAA